MLLSIGMIVKNEEKRLPGCLSSIKPILDSVESELIIYDTGSTDGTVNIAKEYTDKVFQIEWRNDFAWARNHTLDKARGKWFMYVDADEVFRDTSDLVSFFNSGEYKQYGCADYVWDNIHSGTNTFFRPLRLFKMHKDIRFLGKIHEYIEPIEPRKHLKSLAVHYGYDFKSLAEKKAKSARNLPPLLEELEQNPDDTRVLYLISQDYFVTEDYDMALSYIERGLTTTDQSEILYHALYHKLPDIYFIKSKPEDAVTAIRRYFSETQVLYQNAIKFRIIEAMSLAALKRPDEAITAFKQAHEFFRQNKQGLLGEKLTSFITLEAAFLLDDSQIVEGVTGIYVNQRKFDEAWEWVQKHSPKLAAKKKHGLYQMYAAHALEEKRYGDLAFLYDHAKSSVDVEDYESAIMIIEKSLHNKEIKQAVVEAAKPGEDDYGRLLDIRKQYASDNPSLKQNLRHFLESGKPFSQLYADVVIYAMKEGADFSTFLENMQTNNSDEICHTIRTTDNAAKVLLGYLEAGIPQDASIKFIRILSHVAVFFLNSAVAADEPEDESAKKEADETKIRLLEAASRAMHRYLKLVYKDEIYSGNNIAALPERDSFFYFTGTAHSCKDAGDISGYVKNLGEAIKLAPQMKDTIKLVLERLQEQNQAQAPPPPTSMRELQAQLADEISNLKNIIFATIKSGNKQKAEYLINTYATINPKDPDIATIKEMIASWVKDGSS